MLLKAMMGHVLAYIHVYRGGQSGTRWDTVGHGGTAALACRRAGDSTRGSGRGIQRIRIITKSHFRINL